MDIFLRVGLCVFSSEQKYEIRMWAAYCIYRNGRVHMYMNLYCLRECSGYKRLSCTQICWETQARSASATYMANIRKADLIHRWRPEERHTQWGHDHHCYQSLPQSSRWGHCKFNNVLVLMPNNEITCAHAHTHTRKRVHADAWIHTDTSHTIMRKHHSYVVSSTGQQVVYIFDGEKFLQHNDDGGGADNDDDNKTLTTLGKRQEDDSTYRAWYTLRSLRIIFESERFRNLKQISQRRHMFVCLFFKTTMVENPSSFWSLMTLCYCMMGQLGSPQHITTSSTLSFWLRISMERSESSSLTPSVGFFRKLAATKEACLVRRWFSLFRNTSFAARSAMSAGMVGNTRNRILQCIHVNVWET